MTSSKALLVALCLLVAPSADAFAFVARTKSSIPSSSTTASSRSNVVAAPSSSGSSSLKMIDQSIIQGGAVAVAGLAFGVGIVAFTEAQGERAKERGSGLSDRMATEITGGLMEDTEVSSVSDLGSLTSQLENALKETGTVEVEEMSEEEKKRIAEEADDGW